MLDVGMIGSGPAWESRYRPALQRLRDRIQVRTVFDVVQSRAHHVAQSLSADVAPGLVAMMSRPDIRAILMLDADWLGPVPLQLACRYGKPVYIAGGLGESLERIETLQHCAAEQGIDLVPEFSRRYTPATSRLRELMATRLGRIRSISLEARLPLPHAPDLIPGQESETDFLVGLIDWCCYLIGTRPQQVKPAPVLSPTTFGAGEPRWRWEIEFDRSLADGTGATVEAIIHPASTPTPCVLRGRIQCARGEAIVEDGDRIHWKNGEGGHVESLSAERPDVEVMLDHFCRRVVGGLVPVPNVEAVSRALALVHRARSLPGPGI